MERPESIYNALLGRFGKQNWWPMQRGFSPPEWEVCIGAVLTQNTSWRNAELALSNLRKSGLVARKDIGRTGEKKLAALIRPSGYYNQKARKLKVLASFRGEPTRENLLGLWGIGPETADSILLYAYGKPHFVIDAYTKRVFSRLGFDARKHSGKGGRCTRPDYDAWQLLFQNSLPKDVHVYGEFHALVVELAKRHCRKKPVCNGCPLEKGCKKRI